MYQFYYSDSQAVSGVAEYNKKVSDILNISYIRPTMWEEHCLECSAPLCYKSCPLYVKRSDGRCARFYNGLSVYTNEKGCCNEGVRVKFREWSNMLTIIFPGVVSREDYLEINKKNKALGKILSKIARGSKFTNMRWFAIRVAEYLRRCYLRKSKNSGIGLSAFVFHGFSFEREPFNLQIEIYDDHMPLFRTSVLLNYGENLRVIEKNELSKECFKPGNLVKIYPENNIEAEIDILWCDFVSGDFVKENTVKKDNERSEAKVKCVVWDLDNTLWDGILIESDNPLELQLRSGVIEAIHKFDEMGILQSIASKNDYAQAYEVIKKLGIEDYFLYPQINWGAKSDSITQIASSLNIGIASFALIDDSSFERRQVASVLPQVRIYEETEIASLFSRPEFDLLVTDESKNRRLMYKVEEKRNIERTTNNLGTIEFLKKCNLRIHISVPRTNEEKNRAYELIQRTNQLNMSGQKYSESEFKNILNRAGCVTKIIVCSDNYGSYGIVGFYQYEVCNGRISFNEYAMSCRVAGKYVESALFAYLLQTEKCEYGIFSIKKTKKNILLRNTLEEIGFTVKSENDGVIDYQFTDDLKHKELVGIGD